MIRTFWELPVPRVFEAPSGLKVKYKVSAWRLLRWRLHDLRERVGFWIAGYTPPDD